MKNIMLFLIFVCAIAVIFSAGTACRTSVSIADADQYISPDSAYE